MRNRQRGFTLIEMLIVVAIIAIIATIATPRLQRAWQRAQKTRTLTDMRVISNAIDAYMSDPGTGGSYPAGLQGAVAETIAPVAEPKFIAKCPRADRWGMPFQYISDSDGFGYSLVSYGRDRRQGSREGAGTDGEFFPAKDQKPEQQAKDEQACYSWAVEQSGVDPLNMPATKPDSVAKGPDGSAVKGAAKGALAGAAIGAIAGDAGKGAAIGAADGGMGGVAGKRKKDAQKEQQAQQKAVATDQAKIDSFKKAYSACLEGKGYTVK